MARRHGSAPTPCDELAALMRWPADLERCAPFPNPGVRAQLPPQRSGCICDYAVTIPMTAGATVTLSAYLDQLFRLASDNGS